jgi:hypothetical protein
MRPETLKLVQERARNTLELIIGIGNNFLSRIQTAQQLRKRTDKWDYMKFKSFCTKETVSKLKRLPSDWEKIFASYIFDKGLITRIYKEFKKLHSQKNK